MASSAPEGSKDSDCERVFKRFTYKCLQTILQSRIERPTIFGRESSNDYFSINFPDSSSVDDQVKSALEGIKSFPVKDKSICVEVALRTSDGDHMFLETWDLSFSLSSLDMSACKVQHIYTRMGLCLKSILSATRAVPGYRLSKNQGEKGGGYIVNCRIYLGSPKTHMLGEGFKTVKAGAVPSAYGLLSVNVAYRTKLLLSPDAASCIDSIMQMTDDYFMTERKAKHSSSPLFSDPQPCRTMNRPHSLSSPGSMAAPPYHYTISPSSHGTDDDAMSKVVPDTAAVWPLSSLLNLEDLPEPAVGAFSVQRPGAVKLEEDDLPFEGLMKRSMLARLEQKQGMCKQGDDSGFERSNEVRHQQIGVIDEEKENVNVWKAFINNPPVEDDFVIVDPPFASDDDPRDVKSFLGCMFRAPHLYDSSEIRLSVGDYLKDVGQMVTQLEEDMPMLDEFCRSVIEFDSQDDEEAAVIFS